MPPLEDETDRFIAAWMQVRQIVQAANFNRFQRAGLSATQFMTLNVVPTEGLTLSELARKLNLSAATLHATVNSLEERGLLTRTRSAADARKIDLHATAEGQAMQNAASDEFRRLISGLFARMTTARRAGLLAGLEQMIELSEPGQQGYSKNDVESGPASTLRGGAAARAKRSSPRSPPR